jgi:hypothetical protein
MQAYKELVELARICGVNARLASTQSVARELWRMANEYRSKAMNLNGGKPIDLGPSPPLGWQDE